MLLQHCWVPESTKYVSGSNDEKMMSNMSSIGEIAATVSIVM